MNDLHKASGGAEKDKPANWTRKDEFRDLIDQLLNDRTSNCSDSSISPAVTTAGRYGGTYVVKELVYAYAMWISAAFQLKVIRAFDRLRTQGVAVAENSL